MRFQLSITIIVFILCVITTQSTSKYEGVSWNEKRNLWQTEFDINGKVRKFYFNNEFDAVKKLNQMWDKMRIPPQNPKICELPNQQVPKKTSQYNGVYWYKDKNKWYALLQYNQKRYHGGYFDNEKDAAMKVNLLCDKYEMTRKNPMIDINADLIQQVLKNQTSIYTGVCWHKDAKKWQARLMHNKKVFYIGLFDNEEQAAMQMNLFCDKNGIERKNPMIEIEPDAIHQVCKTSKYTGVCWNKDHKKWQAQLKHNNKSYYGRYFDNEEHADMSVNLLCDKYEIARKNPVIDIKEDVIQQVNKDIKIEDKNIFDGFKDECKNRFIKSNDEESHVTTASGKSQKRKRKQKEEPIMDDVVEEKLEITTPNTNDLLEKIQKY
jgi:phage terminase small subunit